MLNEEIRLSTRSGIIGKNILTFDCLDSTNLKAKSLLQEGEDEGTIVFAEEQTAGRGRLGRSWVSERGKNLTFSVTLKPKISPEFIGIVSLYAGLAVASAIEEQMHIRPECKWPNDVLLNWKKCCGILSEAVFTQGNLAGVVIGIGINVNQTAFPTEIQTTATSLAIVKGEPVDRNSIFAAVIKQMNDLYGSLQAGYFNHLRECWNNYCSIFGKTISIRQHDTIITGIATRIADDGGLILTINGKEQKVLAGDVTLN